MDELPVEQLITLAKNPYYQMNDKDKKRLADFLKKEQAKSSKKSQKKNSKESDEKPVTVRNVVEKAQTYAPDASERTSNDV